MPPLDIPDVFSQMTVSPVASRSRDGGKAQATRSQGSGTSGTTPQSESASARSYERHVGRFCAHKSILTGYYSTAISKPDTSRLFKDPEEPPPAPTPASHRKTPSPPAVVTPPSPLRPIVQGKLRLPPYDICHSPKAQRLMESRRISWGVQYELARGILADKWKWEDVTDRVLDRLQGSNAVAAPKVRSVMAEVIGQGNTAYHVDFGTTAQEVWLVFEPNVRRRCSLTALPGRSMTENRMPFLSASHGVWV